ncbi:glycine betaine ABC transporter substrate-binding protein [Salibacterium halotolerans]|uniref:Glycine betaine/proline transport system substrate-binding protein n=1 Tax=Salibacterium halotolerans TaxID=1884432 RepID=A0A1I5WWC3_9BACI|nr:glycine betaine ABC transporter substrate-binding protein [Salibacterium halotolerans]SFQ23980.1 glycine betaine/proline transport system substrate-binding protein [Salibacterium halotolerans]
MKRLLQLFVLGALTALTACGGGGDEAAGSGSTGNEGQSEEAQQNSGNNKGETITFGKTSWTSTAGPTQIAKQMLEEAGYNVEIELLDQPVIWEGMQSEEIDFFMDAWLPYTEEQLWNEYQDDLQKVATSYEQVPTGWVVPEYVEAESISDIKENPEKFGGKIYTIGAGAGIVNTSKEVMADYNLEEAGFELMPSSETAMISELKTKISNEEPVIITGWRPHSMFVDYDLKFLEEPKENFKYDNVYVLSYQGIQEKYPEAYNILSNWSISVDDLEKMMYEHAQNDTPFEELAANWIEENQDKVDAMMEGQN